MSGTKHIPASTKVMAAAFLLVVIGMVYTGCENRKLDRINQRLEAKMLIIEDSIYAIHVMDHIHLLEDSLTQRRIERSDQEYMRVMRDLAEIKRHYDEARNDVLRARGDVDRLRGIIDSTVFGR